MNRGLIHSLLAASLLAVSFAAAGVQHRRRQRQGPLELSAGRVGGATAAVEQPIARFIRATGTLMAEEQADVAAETAGRVVSAPVERGTADRARRGAGADFADRNGCAAQGSAGQRRAARGAPRPDDGRRLRRQRRPRGTERKGVVRAGAERVQSHQVAARPARRVAVGVRSAPDADGSGAADSTRPRRTARRSSIRCCRRRARACRSPRKPSPTPWFARRSTA